MCYKWPGPRCTNHARKNLVKAVSARRRLMQAGGSTVEERLSAQEAVDKAELDFDATPGGQADLRRRIDRGEDRGNHGELAARLDLGIARRKEALAAIKSEDLGDKKHRTMSADKAKVTEQLSILNQYVGNSLPADDAVRQGWKFAPNQEELEEGLIGESSRWTDSLTSEQQDNVRWYTSNGAHVMNKHILGQEDTTWNDEYAPERVQAAIESLDDAFAKYKGQDKRVVYRGLQEMALPEEVHNGSYEDRDKNIAEFLKRDFAIGSTFTSSIHMSASLDPASAKSFSSDDVLMEIVTNRAAPVVTMSAWGISEREALVQRNTPFKVVGVKDVIYRNMDRRTKETVDKTIKVIQLEQI